MDAQEENAALRQVITLIAASFPTQLITGKTGDWVSAMCRAIVTGEPSEKWPPREV